MGAAVQIVITADASGAITVTNQYGQTLQKLAPPSKKIKDEFDGIEKAEKRAHIAGSLFAQLTGVEMPRAMEQVISRSSIFGPMLAGAFNVAIISSATQAVIGFADQIVSAAQSLGGMSEGMKKLMADTIKASEESFAHPQTLAIAKEHLSTERSVLEMIGKQADEYKNLNIIQRAEIRAIASDYLGANEEAKLLVSAEEKLAHQKEINEQLSQSDIELTRAVRDVKLSAQAEVNEAGLKGFKLIEQQHRDQDTIARASFDFLSGMSDALNAKLRENAAKAAAAAKELNRTLNTELIRITQSVEQSILQGHARINQEEQDNVANYIAGLMEETGFTYTELMKRQKFAAMIEAATAAFHRKAAHDNTEVDRQTTRDMEALLEQQRDAQEATSLSYVADWQRSTAQIIIEANKQIRIVNQQTREMQERYKDDGNRLIQITATAQDRRTAIWAQANERIREEHKHLVEELGSDLQSVFDDISSGNIGKRILSNIEKLFFQIVAQWILSLNMMKSAAGSIFGSIVFGPGSTGSNVFGGGASPLGILGGLFGGGQSAMVPAGAPTGAAPGFGNFSIPGLGAVSPAMLGIGGGLGSAAAGTSAPAGGFSASNALTSATIAEATGAGPAGNTVGSAVNGALSAASGTKMSGFMGAVQGFGGLGLTLLGGLGGKVGQLGSFLSSATMMGLFAHAGAAAPFLAALGPALLGFGIGSNFGPLGGALAGGGSGFAAGALIGLAGGPIGAIVGGIIGAIAGLFGGIFGSGKRKKQANSFVDNTVLPNIQQILSEYDSFQVDSNSAIQQLEQIRTDSQKELSKLKSQGKDVFRHRVDPAVADAEAHIRNTQSERDRRAATVFGPPQFAGGGLFMVGPGANAGLAVLHDGESVNTAAATKKSFAAIKAINAGETIGSNVNVVMNVNTLSPQTFGDYLRGPAGKEMLKALRRMIIEGN